MSERMSDERLAVIADHADRLVNYGGMDDADRWAEQSPSYVTELLAEVEWLRKLESSLVPEWGYRSRGEKNATPAPSEEYARTMAERRKEQVASRLRTDWINPDA